MCRSKNRVCRACPEKAQGKAKKGAAGPDIAVATVLGIATTDHGCLRDRSTRLGSLSFQIPKTGLWGVTWAKLYRIGLLTARSGGFVGVSQDSFLKCTGLWELLEEYVRNTSLCSA